MHNQHTFHSCKTPKHSTINFNCVEQQQNVNKYTYSNVNRNAHRANGLSMQLNYVSIWASLNTLFIFYSISLVVALAVHENLFFVFDKSTEKKKKQQQQESFTISK